MLELKPTKQFKKDSKKYKQNNIVINKLRIVVEKLQCCQKLPELNRDHNLLGSNKGKRECHVMPDVLLIYRVYQQQLILERIGSHSELF